MDRKYLVPAEMALPNQEARRNFQRNEKLIDLSKSPEEIFMSCLRAYQEAPEGDRSKLLNYFIEKRLTSLTENIGEFLKWLIWLMRKIVITHY